ncbi:MAG: hypothetical protein CL840_18950 [Crocinitomicaceae bacterium]|nr:hypothetical protein [Crocinitomicaceae bacterium]|tara:strand:- start:11247 stop:11675 length:429 start_codon:yes stop_codon:yes gene_type:complete
MDHVVYLDAKAKELDNLLSGEKNMVIRGAMGRKMPYGRVNSEDTLYFIENKGDGLVKAKAGIRELIQSDKLTKEESVMLVENNQVALKLNPAMFKRFAGKRYLILITVEDVEPLDPFKIDRSEYGNMDDWLPVGDINHVRLN